MFRKSLTGCLTAVAIAAGSAFPSVSPASASGLTLQFSFGQPGYYPYPYVMHHRYRPVLVCKTKIKIVWRHHKKHRVKVKSCHWVYPGQPYAPMPYHYMPMRY
jgi:hypothetical protein